MVLGNNRSVRFRHAAVWVCGLGEQLLGGTTEAVFFSWVRHWLMLHLFSLVGLAYVAGKLLPFKP